VLGFALTGYLLPGIKGLLGDAGRTGIMGSVPGGERSASFCREEPSTAT
jgi:hypothetical protein